MCLVRKHVAACQTVRQEKETNFFLSQQFSHAFQREIPSIDAKPHVAPPYTAHIKSRIISRVLIRQSSLTFLLFATLLRFNVKKSFLFCLSSCSRDFGGVATKTCSSRVSSREGEGETEK